MAEDHTKICVKCYKHFLCLSGERCLCQRCLYNEKRKRREKLIDYPPVKSAERLHDCDSNQWKSLVDIFTSVHKACDEDFPTISSLRDMEQGSEKFFRCHHTYNGSLWNTKIKYGRVAESGEGYVKVRMPICDFGIYNSCSHGDSTLPRQLFPLVEYFQNWLSGNDFDCTVQVWRNDRSGTDIELSADGKENKWSLSFEPWSPVIESTHPGLYDAESIKAMFPAVKADKP